MLTVISCPTGSGSNVDICIIGKDKTEMHRNFSTPNERAVKERKYGFRRGTTAWTKEDVRSMVVEETVQAAGEVGMDMS